MGRTSPSPRSSCPLMASPMDSVCGKESSTHTLRRAAAGARIWCTRSISQLARLEAWGRQGPAISSKGVMYTGTGDGNYNPEIGSFGNGIVGIQLDQETKTPELVD